MSDLSLRRIVFLGYACWRVLAFSSAAQTPVVEHCDESDEVRLVQTKANLHVVRRDSSVLRGEPRVVNSTRDVAFEVAVTAEVAPDRVEAVATEVAPDPVEVWSVLATAAGAGNADSRVAENVSVTAEGHAIIPADTALLVPRAVEKVMDAPAKYLFERDAAAEVADQPAWSASNGLVEAVDADALVADTISATAGHALESEPTSSSRMCVANTGGKCRFSSCDSWRGGTTCSLGRCLCQDGLCAGADGKCHLETNELAASGFRLRNARWPEFLLHFPTHFTYMKVHHTTHQDDSELFDVYVLPGSNRTECLLSSSVDPDRVSAALTGEEGSFAATKMIGNRAIGYLGSRLMRAPKFEGVPPGSVAVMISPMERGLRGSYYTVVAGAWEVAVTRGDTGTGAYWLVEPASALDDLPLPDFDGRACTWDCGSYGSGASVVAKAWTTAVAALCLSPIVVGLVAFWIIQRHQMVGA